MLKMRTYPEGQKMARYLQWILLKTETRERRGSLLKRANGSVMPLMPDASKSSSRSHCSCARLATRTLF